MNYLNLQISSFKVGSNLTLRQISILMPGLPVATYLTLTRGNEIKKNTKSTAVVHRKPLEHTPIGIAKNRKLPNATCQKICHEWRYLTCLMRNVIMRDVLLLSNILYELKIFSSRMLKYRSSAIYKILVGYIIHRKLEKCFC